MKLFGGSASADFLAGDAAARVVIVAWLRARTNLTALAQLIEDDIPSKSAQEQADYCEKNGILLR